MEINWWFSKRKTANLSNVPYVPREKLMVIMMENFQDYWTYWLQDIVFQVHWQGHTKQEIIVFNDHGVKPKSLWIKMHIIDV